MNSFLRKLAWTMLLGLLVLWSACKKERASNPMMPPTDTTHSAPDTTIPARPTGLHAVLLSSHRLQVMWQDNSRREYGYRVERSFATTDSFQLIGTTDSNVVTFTDTTVNPMVLNYYRVYAFNSYGNSSYSNVDSIVIRTFGQSAQEDIAPVLLCRVYEITKLVDQYQRGYAALHPHPDTMNYLRQTDSSYQKVTGDSLKESVRFRPDVWLHPTLSSDSIWYKWDLYGGDTIRHGRYSYTVNGKRLSADSIARDTGTVRFDLGYYGVGWGGAWNDYGYWLLGTFIEPIGLSGAAYNWTGVANSVNVDLTPVRWGVDGTSSRDATGIWTTQFRYAQSTFLTATVDSTGIGSYYLKWDNFTTPYYYRYQ